MTNNDKILVARSSMPPFEEYCEEVKELWDSHWLTNKGVKHRQFENNVKEYLDVDQLLLFVNGHSALECILETMDLGKDGRNEVVTTPFTFASTTHAIVRKGLKPVFGDIRKDDYTLDPDKIEGLITERTCAILPVHVYGNICSVDRIQEIADKHDLKVIYDAAHAFGVKRNGVGIGNYGDASTFSFHATKVFNTIEGGAIAHADESLSSKLAQWRNFGIASAEDVVYVGGNSKMNEFAAAMGLCNLRHVDSEIAKRKIVAERYFQNLKDVPGITITIPPDNIQSNYAYMPVLIDPDVCGVSRDVVFEELAKNNIAARKYFYPLTSDFACYTGMFPSSESATPIAKKVSDQVLSLPIYADLAISDVDRICDIVISSSSSVSH